MTINTQKLLPPSKFTGPIENITSVSSNKNVNDDSLLIIKRKLISIDKLLKNSLIQEKKETSNVKRKKQVKSREEREKKIETPNEPKGIQKIKSLIPSTGIFDAVQRFATFTFIGWLFTKFSENIPKLLEITKKISPVVNTVEKIIGGIFEGVVGFIDTGYKITDQIRKLSKDIGGEKAQKVYDDFTKNFNYITNAILTIGLSTLVQPKPTPKKSNGGLVTSYAQGGTVTRGGQTVGGPITRTIKVQPKKIDQRTKIRPQSTQPGKDVGGKLEIEKLYPNPKVSETTKPNSYKLLSESSKSLKKTGTTGILMASGIDLVLGQNIESNLLNSISNDIALKSNINQILQNVRKEINKKRTRGGSDGPGRGASGNGFDDSEGGYVSPDLGRTAGGSQELKEEVIKSSRKLGIDAPSLLGAILAESGGDPSKTNQFGCTGLIQFCPGKSSGQAVIGKTGDQLRRMSIAEQMPYVVKYLRSVGVKSGMSGYDIYSAIHAGRPGGNKEDANGVTTRGYYESNVKPLIEKARKEEQSNIIKGGRVRGGALITQRGDPDAEQTGSDISVGNYKVGAQIQNPFKSLKITDVNFQGSGSGNSGTGYGRYITGETVINGKKYEILLGHLNKALVKKGDILETGDIIGTQGISGHATGPHVTTHINALNGGNPHRVLKLVEDSWVKGGMIETSSMGEPTSKKEPPRQPPRQQPSGRLTAEQARELQIQSSNLKPGDKPLIFTGIGSIQMGKDFFGKPKKKYFNKDGKEITQKEFNELMVKYKLSPGSSTVYQSSTTISSKTEPERTGVIPYNGQTYFKKGSKYYEELPGNGVFEIPKQLYDLVPRRQGGGLIGPQSKRNYSSLSSYPSYDTSGDMMIAVQPIIVEKPIPIPSGGNKTIIFPVPVSVNSNTASLRR